jgi:succinate dehydrogenase/fumarate reductase flavoprotein subunit
VQLLMQTELREIERGIDGAVEAVRLAAVGAPDGAARRVAVRGGVVLASGGFNRHAAWRAQRLPGIPAEWCPAAPGHTGQAQDVALAVGARHGEGAASPAFWAPVSLRRRADGSTAAFPHFVMDRAKPGMLTVDTAGRRFVNESTSYHRFGLAMQRAPQAVPAFLICDAAALRRHGLGMVRPGGKGLAPFLADGYLTEASTLAELAQRLGIDPAGLQASVARFNAQAEAGLDPDFHRGETDYQRNIGDATWPGRNPCLGPLATAPFYAVRLYPGDIGAATGLRTDAQARVLDAAGAPIAGLYAVGNDAQSIMGGTYPGPGITIGPGMVFGHIAARDAWRRAQAR